jgi:hypothetical protein
MRSLTSHALLAAVTLVGTATAATAVGQVVSYPAYRPVIAAPVIAAPVVAAPVVAAPVVAPTYVSTDVPAGNYAAVTAFSPPLVTEPAVVAVRAAYPPAYGAIPAAPVATTVTTFYAPTAVAAAPVIAAPAVVPVTTYYAPAAVAVPMRRGIFGGWRPVRGAYAIPY